MCNLWCKTLGSERTHGASSKAFSETARRARARARTHTSSASEAKALSKEDDLKAALKRAEARWRCPDLGTSV